MADQYKLVIQRCCQWRYSATLPDKVDIIFQLKNINIIIMDDFGHNYDHNSSIIAVMALPFMAKNMVDHYALWLLKDWKNCRSPVKKLK